MNRYLRRLGLGGSGPRAELQGESWRQVPRISITTAAVIERRSRVLILALAFVLAVELFLIQDRYRELDRTSVGVETLTSELQLMEDREAEQEFALEESAAEIDRINSQRDAVTSVYDQVRTRHVSWGASLLPLFDFNIPGIAISEVTAQPDLRETKVTGVAQEVADIVRFRAHVENEASPLDLLSMNTEQVEGTHRVVATFKLKAAEPGLPKTKVTRVGREVADIVRLRADAGNEASPPDLLRMSTEQVEGPHRSVAMFKLK